MKQSNSKCELTRRGFLAAATLGLGTTLIPPAAWADGVTTAPIDPNPFDSLKLDQVDEATWVLTNTDTGEITTGVFSDDKAALRITHDDGSASVVDYTENGTVLHDGKVLFEVYSAPSISLLSVPSGYKPLVTHRTHVSVYQDAYDVILSLVGIVPVAGGIINALAALFRDHSLDDAYIEIAQYYHPSTYYIYTVVRFYRYSNYTGLLATREYGPRPPV